MQQDNFYSKVESNNFFKRWKNINKVLPAKLRTSKVELLNILSSNIKLKKKKILEIGCFIGDLLYELKETHQCKVHGVEPSSFACKFAKEKFKLNLENTTFIKSKFFMNKKFYKKIDIIICEDVFSWMDRSIIIPTLGSIDWILKDNGYILIRDYTPPYNFAYKHHHYPQKKIFSFKQANGHKTLFLNSGKYVQIYNKQISTSKYQKIKINEKVGLMWSDTLLMKVKNFTHPVKKIK
jgi:SAM-dependent methyltransferase